MPGEVLQFRGTNQHIYHRPELLTGPLLHHDPIMPHQTRQVKYPQ